jgi:Tfp pilus assembly protein PilP
MKKGLLLFLLVAVWAKAQENNSAGQGAVSESTGFSFNPLSIKRDPFFPPVVQDNESLSELQRFDVNQMNLVAILTGMGKPQAMIVLPNGRTETVSVGEPIGRRKGVVAEITPTKVKIKEAFRDYQNRVKTDITTLEIVN